MSELSEPLWTIRNAVQDFYPSQEPNFALQSSDPWASHYADRDIPAPIYKNRVKHNCASNPYNVPWDEQVLRYML